MNVLWTQNLMDTDHAIRLIFIMFSGLKAGVTGDGQELLQTHLTKCCSL